MTCDRVVIINKGKIAAVDTPQNLTSQLKSGQKIRLEVDAPADGLKKRARAGRWRGACAVEQLPSSAHSIVTVETAQGADIRSDIAAKIIGSGWPLYELRGVSLSLEDIFLELTTDDASHAQPSRELKSKPGPGRAVS